jgi:hypothetical protein
MAARTWWKFTPDMCNQPEVKELASIIELPTFAAAGAVALLYVWAIGKTDDSGNINEYTTKAIETACMWEGKRGDLLNAFHASGVIIGDIHDRDDDDPLRIANWANVAADILNERQRTRTRVQKHRSNGNAQDVTEGVTRYTPEDVTWPKNKEQRVKEYKSNRVQEQRKPCDLCEVETFFRENGLIASPRRFFEFYASSDWTTNGEPIQDWRRLALAWDKADRAKASPALVYDQRNSTDYSGHIIDLSEYADE